MKKYYFIIAALFAIAAVSCQKETAAPENPAAAQDPSIINVPEGAVKVFSANLPEVLDTRTVIGAPDGSGKYTPLWTDSDGIIVNGVASTNTEVQPGGTSANFTVGGVTAPYLALSPASLISDAQYNYDEANHAYDYLVCGSGRPQNYSTNGGNPTYDAVNGTTIAAYGTAESLTFNHLCVYYKITVNAGSSSDAENIRSIYIRQGDGSNIAGTWTATFNGVNDITIAPKSLTNVIKLDCGEGGVAHGTSMMVSVPAFNFANGLIITLKDLSGHFCSYAMKSTATQFADIAGSVVEFNPVFSPGPGTISSAEDWEAFAAAMNSGKDQDLYRWVGNGTVKIGASFSSDTLTRINNLPANYTLDGQGYTITRTAANTNLFVHVRGSVQNLNLAGNLNVSSQTGALTFALDDDGSITNCSTSMAISFNGASHAYVGGLVSQVNGGTITGCSNTGTINVSVDNSAADHNISVGGIAGQVCPETAHITLTDCTNSGAITVTPQTDGTCGSKVFGVGGITGWLRGSTGSFTLTNCDNSAPLTISASGISGTVGGHQYSCCLGGIVGIGSSISTSIGALNTPTGDNGINVSFYNCDNTGLLTNCYTIDSEGPGNNKKVYTGGIAGSLMGNSDDYIELDKCTNIGDITTYNLTGASAATTPGYVHVAGGLVGFGGYLAVSNKSWVVCTIGDRKRAAFAYAGVIGMALRPFTVDDTTVWITLNMVRLAGANCNNASIAALPYRFRKNDGKYVTLSPAPDFGTDYSTISITNSTIGGNLNYTDLAVGSYGNTDDKSGASPSSLPYESNKEIRGNKDTNITATPASVVRTSNTSITSDPTPAP